MIDSNTNTARGNRVTTSRRDDGRRDFFSDGRAPRLSSFPDPPRDAAKRDTGAVVEDPVEGSLMVIGGGRGGGLLLSSWRQQVVGGHRDFELLSFVTSTFVFRVWLATRFSLGVKGHDYVVVVRESTVSF